MRETSGDIELSILHAQAADKIAKSAVEKLGDPALVAMSLTASGDCYKPKDTPRFDTLVQQHSVDLDVFHGLGDFIMAETLPTAMEGQVVSRLANEREQPFAVSFVAGDDGKILDGSTMGHVVETILSPHEFCLGVGVNCCSIEGAKIAVAQLSEAFEQARVKGKHIIVYANAFTLSLAQKEALGIESDEVLQEIETKNIAQELADLGATMIGFCCGATPNHTRNTRKFHLLRHRMDKISAS